MIIKKGLWSFKYRNEKIMKILTKNECVHRKLEYLNGMMVNSQKMRNFDFSTFNVDKFYYYKMYVHASFESQCRE